MSFLLLLMAAGAMAQHDYFPADTYLTAVREADGRVYALFPDEPDEQLLFDFRLSRYCDECVNPQGWVHRLLSLGAVTTKILILTAGEFLRPVLGRAKRQSRAGSKRPFGSSDKFARTKIIIIVLLMLLVLLELLCSLSIWLAGGCW